jgi:hypothetical protein
MSAGLEVADIFRRHGDAYRRAHDGHLGRVERRVMSAIELCRTAALGGHTEVCSACGLVRCAYNSCRNRHCPKCQGQARAEWLAARQAELLPAPYFHVVFTLPAPVAEIAFQNKETVYAILFKAAAETLRTIGADPKHLGAEIGLVAVLHTWGRTCITIRTSIASCRVAAWRRTARAGLPAGPASSCRSACCHACSRLFLDKLRAAFEAGHLGFFGDLAELARPAVFTRRLRELRRVECRVGGDVAAPTPHRPGRADFPHPVLHERDSLAAA